MLTLYYTPGTCSIAPRIVLEESGEAYEAKRIDLSQGEQRTEAYRKIHPQGRVPALGLDGGGPPLTENTAILPYLGKRYKLWPLDPLTEARALSIIGFFSSTVHPAHAHISRPERYATDASYFPHLQEQGRKAFHGYLQQIDDMLAGRQWLSDQYSVLDPYAFTFYTWGMRRELPMAELKHYSAHKDRMLARPAVRRVVEVEGIKV
ncbi:MAG: glutathione S-transferase N-terminal domain-containing protein [Hyphomonadaceae bacterium]|jgi:glutathione S-transferase|nr:glutathione S-transferase N-terminal domain-containing protein [Hyphomonadaceae bacterium]